MKGDVSSNEKDQLRSHHNSSNDCDIDNTVTIGNEVKIARRKNKYNKCPRRENFRYSFINKCTITSLYISVSFTQVERLMFALGKRLIHSNKRYCNHVTSCNNICKRHSTSFGDYVCRLLEDKIEYKIAYT